MPPILFTDGLDETEPTLSPDGSVQDCTGMEYRVGEIGPFVARGRDLYGTISGVTLVGGYQAGFDTAQTIVAHAGNSLFWGAIGATQTVPALFDNLPSGTSAIVGCHYANRHYTAMGALNRRLEYASGVTSFPIGMSRSTLSVGVSVTQGAGSISAATGLVYWVTEYDSVRGIESMTGASVSTGAFTSKDSVIVTATGVSANPLSNELKWYRSVDGGGFPDGGLIATTAIGVTTITDTLAATSNFTVPLYGLISVGGDDTERDEPPDPMSVIFGPFQDSLLGVAVADRRVLRFTPAGYPDSWPSRYGVPIETSVRDEIVTGVVLPGRIGVFCIDSVHVVYRLPRDSDSIFAAGEAQDQITDERGCVSRRGACTFTPPGGSPLAMWVSRDGIWLGNLTGSPTPVTDKTDWDGRVSTENLSTCVLRDDPANRRVVFIYRKATDTDYNTGIWYLDYQDFSNRGIRVTPADHGPLCDAVKYPTTDGKRGLMSFDSRNGQIYVESIQDVDDSHLVDQSGSVHFRMRTKEYLPAGPTATIRLTQAVWMHDAGPSKIEHRFFWNRRDNNSELKSLPDPQTRNSSAVTLGRDINSFSLQLESVGTVSYGVHWLDVDGMDPAPLGGRKGA